MNDIRIRKLNDAMALGDITAPSDEVEDPMERI
jgi:hypothetical protein